MTNLFSLYAFVGRQLWHDWADNEPEDVSSGEMHSAPALAHSGEACAAGRSSRARVLALSAHRRTPQTLEENDLPHHLGTESQRTMGVRFPMLKQ